MSISALAEKIRLVVFESLPYVADCLIMFSNTKGGPGQEPFRMVDFSTNIGAGTCCSTLCGGETV